MAHQCAQVVGVEIVEAAVEDAKHNAQLNGITYELATITIRDSRGRNASFIAGKAEEKLNAALSLLSATIKEVVGVVDPPRAGLHPKTLSAIRACERIHRLVYVSCNQNAFVNDAAAYIAFFLPFFVHL